MSSRFPAASQGRTVVHVDMDAFFASIEALLHPEYRGKPLIVGADPRSNRGVVSTCSYEARAYGVRSAMPIREAYRRCPHAIFVRPDMPTYVAYSRQSEGSARPVYPHRRAALHRRGLSRHDGVRALLSFAPRDGKSHQRGHPGGHGPYRFRRHRARTNSWPNLPPIRKAGRPRRRCGLGSQSFFGPAPRRRAVGRGPKGGGPAVAQLGIATIGSSANVRAAGSKGARGHRCDRISTASPEGIRQRVAPRASVEAQSISREITFEADVQDPQVLTQRPRKIRG